MKRESEKHISRTKKNMFVCLFVCFTLSTDANLLSSEGRGPFGLGLLKLGPKVAETGGSGLVRELEVGVVLLADLGGNEDVVSDEAVLELALLHLFSLLEVLLLSGQLQAFLRGLGEVAGVVVINPGLDPLRQLTSSTSIL